MKREQPELENFVKWYHQLAALPMRALATLKIGPFKEEPSLSAIIEAILAAKRNEEVGYQLTGAERMFAKALTNRGIPDEVIEYRELSHEVQREILNRWGKQRLGVIWIGAGVFTLSHPLLANSKPEDWHIWSDAHQRVVSAAQELYQKVKARSQQGELIAEIILPDDVQALNRSIALMEPDVDHIIIFGYGVTYALTYQENYQWLKYLALPENKPASFVFNAPAKPIPFGAGITAATHRQRMMHYTREAIESLFRQTILGSKIIWEKPAEQTRTGAWETWLIHRPV